MSHKATQTIPAPAYEVFSLNDHPRRLEWDTLCLDDRHTEPARTSPA